MTYTNPEDYEPDGEDLDRMTRAQLAELPGPEHTVAQVLDEWNLRENGLHSSSHGVGLFLDLLAAEGYRVTAITVPGLADVLEIEGAGPAPWAPEPPPPPVECDECFTLIRPERLAAHENWHDTKWPRSHS